MAQQPRQYTKEEYAKAEKFMAYNVAPLAYSGVVHPKWLDDERFWYRDYKSDGWDFVIVDPANQTKVPAFDQAKLAAALRTASEGQVKDDYRHLAITDFDFQRQDAAHSTELLVSLGAGQFRCDLAGVGVCTTVRIPGVPEEQTKQDETPRIPLSVSPDKKKIAFIRNFNLWVREVATGQETQLTTDGVKDYGYATDNAGWKQSDRPILVWSPDSKKIATFQQDQRKVGEMYLVPVTNSHPTLKAWKYPLVGDENVTMIERVVVDVDSPKVIRLKMPPDQHRSSLCDDIACNGNTWEDVRWDGSANNFAFVSTSRDHKQEWLRVTDAETGKVREVMSETAPKFLESGNGKVNWKYLPKSKEFLWFSERDNWGELYLYDLTTGKLKNQITRGEGNVTQILLFFFKGRSPNF